LYLLLYRINYVFLSVLLRVNLQPHFSEFKTLVYNESKFLMRFLILLLMISSRQVNCKLPTSISKSVIVISEDTLWSLPFEET